MGLNKAKGRMFRSIGSTWNPLAGCTHGCLYCYANQLCKRWGKSFKPEFREHFLNDKMPEDGSWIFVGSMGDTFCDGMQDEWIEKLFTFIENYQGNNKFLLQTKNPTRLLDWLWCNPEEYNGKLVLGTTLETNRDTPWTKAPTPTQRWSDICELRLRFEVEDSKHERFLSLEPLADFDLDTFTYMIQEFHPTAIEIGLENYTSYLPKPSDEKIRDLLTWLDGNRYVYILKENLEYIESKEVKGEV